MTVCQWRASIFENRIRALYNHLEGLLAPLCGKGNGETEAQIVKQCAKVQAVCGSGTGAGSLATQMPGRGQTL